MYKVTITEIDPANQQSLIRYEQTVDELDFNAVLDAVNRRLPRARAARSDKGRKRAANEQTALSA